MLSKNYVGLSKVYVIVLKFPFDQIISLRIINEKNGYVANEVHNSICQK